MRLIGSHAPEHHQLCLPRIPLTSHASPAGHFLEVVFPAGTYTISGQLNITSSLSSPGVAPRIRGVGMPIITQKDPTSDIFFGDRLWRVEISHLWLTGGRHQLHLGNNNTDQGNIFIHDMQFYEAAGAAIHTIGPSCLEADCPQPAFQGSFSTQLVVRDCKFHHCDQALINWCDWSTFETSWISTSCTMEDKAAIENQCVPLRVFAAPCTFSPPHPLIFTATRFFCAISSAFRAIRIRRTQRIGRALGAGSITSVTASVVAPCMQRTSASAGKTAG